MVKTKFKLDPDINAEIEKADGIVRHAVTQARGEAISYAKRNFEKGVSPILAPEEAAAIFWTTLYGIICSHFINEYKNKDKK